MTDPATQLLSLARMSLDNVWRMAGSAGAITIISTWGQDTRPLTRLTEWLHAGEVPTAWVEETIGWIGRHSDLVEASAGVLFILGVMACLGDGTSPWDWRGASTSLVAGTFLVQTGYPAWPLVLFILLRWVWSATIGNADWGDVPGTYSVALFAIGFPLIWALSRPNQAQGSSPRSRPDRSGDREETHRVQRSPRPMPRVRTRG